MCMYIWRNGGDLWLGRVYRFICKTTTTQIAKWNRQNQTNERISKRKNLLEKSRSAKEHNLQFYPKPISINLFYTLAELGEKELTLRQGMQSKVVGDSQVRYWSQSQKDIHTRNSIIRTPLALNLFTVIYTAYVHTYIRTTTNRA